MKKVILGSAMILGGIYGVVNIISEAILTIAALLNADIFETMYQQGTLFFFATFVLITVVGLIIALIGITERSTGN